MFGFFKKKKEGNLPELFDINNQPLAAGDKVEALRYELGVCELKLIDNNYYYVSDLSGESISWLKMIDASTDNQKVKKIVS